MPEGSHGKGWLTIAPTLEKIGNEIKVGTSQRDDPVLIPCWIDGVLRLRI